MRSRLALAAPLLLLPLLAACGDEESGSASGPDTACNYVSGGTPARDVTAPPSEPEVSGEVTAVLHTSIGDLTAILDADKAPCTVASFESLAEQGYYDDTSCHRQGNDPGFEFLQCGDPGFDPTAATPDPAVGSGGPGYTIPDEIAGDETYPAGTLAMANTGQDNSGGGQFFIVFGDSSFPPSYTVWGHLDEASLATLKEATAAGNDSYWASIGSSGGRPNNPVTFESIEIS
ncbi:peptidylprolyl isomerase [Nocardioides caeni]|nr:peptidylprolyl isomerase [Nocardioides caeni]